MSNHSLSSAASCDRANSAQVARASSDAHRRDGQSVAAMPTDDQFTPTIRRWAETGELIVRLSALGRQGTARRNYQAQMIQLLVEVELRRRASSQRRGRQRSRSVHNVPDDPDVTRERLERALSERLAEARAERHVLAA